MSRKYRLPKYLVVAVLCITRPLPIGKELMKKRKNPSAKQTAITIAMEN